MESPRPDKVAVVEEVRRRLSSAEAAILTEYRGLSVPQLAQLRRALRQAGGEYKIYKNTLVRIAVRDSELSELEGMLGGPTAIAFVETEGVEAPDAARVANALREFSRTNPSLVIKGGLLNNELLSAADATALAELPSREVLLGRVAAGLQAPMQRMAALLAALPQKLAYGLRALVEVREKDGGQQGGGESDHERAAEGQGPEGASEAGGSEAGEAETPA